MKEKLLKKEAVIFFDSLIVLGLEIHTQVYTV